MSVPRSPDLFNPLLAAIKRLGGSASISEMDEEVTKNLNLTDEEIAQPHNERQTELQYQLAWARTHLKTFGMLDNSERGIWVLTQKGRDIGEVDPHQVMRSNLIVRKNKGSNVADNNLSTLTNTKAVEIAETMLDENWRKQLLGILLNLSPAAFERLSQRMLRESGFIEVKVTGRSGDGGIDGVGIIRLGGLLGFPVLFQCKRYQSSVSSGVVRDFRGAMIGRSDRGLIITTGTFTRDAKIEATRDGAPPIDLIDGEQLLDKLKELHLGVDIKMIEQVSVISEFFDAI